MTPTDPEVRRAQEWMWKQPHCIGYHEDGSPSCDGGDLVGESHTPPCPFAERDDRNGCHWPPIGELLAAYSAHENKAAESQLSTLREGLQKVLDAAGGLIATYETSDHLFQTSGESEFYPDGLVHPAGTCAICDAEQVMAEAERILSTSEGSQKGKL